MNEALRRIVAILNELGLPFFAVGSVASSVHGLPRFTQDVDLVVSLNAEDVARLASMTGRDFYFDPEYAVSAIRGGRSFNLIHLSTASKIDIFPLESSEFQESELARSAAAAWAVPGSDAITLPVASAEDTMLFKLVWYEQGGRVSDHQWSDVLGIATRAKPDWDYLRAWAARLGVAELLERLWAEASQFRP
jgi:hypothetical protein